MYMWYECAKETEERGERGKERKREGGRGERVVDVSLYSRLVP
jgi:hypothetical protein